MKKIILLIALSITATTYGDCLRQYASENHRLRWNFDDSAEIAGNHFGPSTFVLPPLGLGTSAYGSTQDKLRVNKTEVPMRVIKDAYLGKGIYLSRVQKKLEKENIIVSLDLLAKQIVQDNEDQVFCRDHLYSYGDMLDYLETML